MAIISISGKMQSGKNTVASIIQYMTAKEPFQFTLNEFLTTHSDFQNNKNCNWKQVAFAGKLKQIVSILTGIPVEDLEKQEVKEQLLGREWNRFLKDDKNGEVFGTPNVRWILQYVGTEAMRYNIHENVWVNALFVDYIDKGKYVNEETTASDGGYYNKKAWQEDLPNWIITDMRFKNELQAIKDRGGLTIRINRNSLQYDAFNEHISETDLDNESFDEIIENNSSIEDLIEKVRQILIKREII